MGFIKVKLDLVYCASVRDRPDYPTCPSKKDFTMVICDMLILDNHLMILVRIAPVDSFYLSDSSDLLHRVKMLTTEDGWSARRVKVNKVLMTLLSLG